MGALALQDGQLVVDLTNVELSPEQYRELVGMVQATVVAFLVKQSGGAKVISVSILPNNNGMLKSS